MDGNGLKDGYGTGVDCLPYKHLIKLVTDMVVTAWRNGNPNGLTGSGYGLRVRKADRDEHFRRDWNEVHLLLEGEEGYQSVSVGNESFWNDCSELRSNAIGQWFLQHGLSEWPQGRPYRFVLTPVRGNQFTLHLPQNG